MKTCRPSSTTRIDRVAVIVPRWTEPDDPEPQGTPFRTFILAGALLAAGYEVVFVDQEHDLDRNDRFAELAVELESACAVFLWFNEMYPANQSENSLRIAQRIRAVHPELPLIVGGEFITVCPTGFFDFPHGIDYFLRGYGEEAGVRLLEHIRAGTDPKDVAGLVYTAADGTRHDRPAETRVRFQSEWLRLYREVDMSVYVQTGGVLGNDQPTLTVATGRGCTKGCRFCAWSNHAPRVLGAGPTFELLAGLRDTYGVKQFHFGELDFFGTKRRALDLADRLAAERPDIRWFALGSPIDVRDFSAEDWDRLAAGGLVKVELGSESGSTRVLRAIGKRHDPEDTMTISAAMLERGIVPMNNFLFGFPGETREDRALTVQLIHRLHELSPERSHFTYRYYQPVWGTGSGDEALALAPETPRRLDRWLAERHLYPAEGARTMPWLPPADEREVKELINFQLPLATSKLRVRSPWGGRIYRGLRGVARRAVGRGYALHPVYRRIFDRVVAGRLDQTYVR